MGFEMLPHKPTNSTHCPKGNRGICQLYARNDSGILYLTTRKNRAVDAFTFRSWRNHPLLRILLCIQLFFFYSIFKLFCRLTESLRHPTVD
jgi:hypothetical protein